MNDRVTPTWVLENFRPGVMARLGLGYVELSAMMVHAEMGYIQVESRYHSSDPQQEPYSHGDLYTSLECLSAILAALYQREHTGEGQHVDVSMAETMLCVNEHGATHLTGMTETLPLATSASPLFKTRSGRTVADEQIRRGNRAQLVALRQDWVMQFPDLASLEAALAKARLVMGVVRSVTGGADRVGEGARRGGGSRRSRWRHVETAELAVAIFARRYRRARCACVSRRTQPRSSGSPQSSRSGDRSYKEAATHR